MKPHTSTHRSPSAATGEERAGTLALFICKGFSGEICRVTLDPGLTPEEAIPEIADRIEYYSPDWEKIGLYNLTRDFEYKPGVPFSETRTEPGDLVMMADGAACHKEG